MTDWRQELEAVYAFLANLTVYVKPGVINCRLCGVNGHRDGCLVPMIVVTTHRIRARLEAAERVVSAVNVTDTNHADWCRRMQAAHELLVGLLDRAPRDNERPIPRCNCGIDELRAALAAWAEAGRNTNA